jgi:hypothetical protein
LSEGQTTKLDQHKHLLVSSPVDPQFEMLIVGCAINLLDGFQKAQFRGPLEKDLEMLKMESLSSRKRIAITNRVGQKQILLANVNLLNILMRILARFKGGTPQ